MSEGVIGILIVIALQSIGLAFWVGGLANKVKDHERRLDSQSALDAALELRAASIAVEAAKTLGMSAEHQRRLCALEESENVPSGATIDNAAEILRIRERLQDLTTQTISNIVRVQLIADQLAILDKRIADTLTSKRG